MEIEDHKFKWTLSVQNKVTPERHAILIREKHEIKLIRQMRKTGSILFFHGDENRLTKETSAICKLCEVFVYLFISQCSHIFTSEDIKY